MNTQYDLVDYRGLGPSVVIDVLFFRTGKKIKISNPKLAGWLAGGGGGGGGGDGGKGDLNCHTRTLEEKQIPSLDCAAESSARLHQAEQRSGAALMAACGVPIEQRRCDTLEILQLAAPARLRTLPAPVDSPHRGRPHAEA